MKRKLILLLLLILNVSSLSFSQDITFKEYSTYGNLLKDLGIITGTNKGLEEEKTLTRQDLVSIINKIYPDQEGYKNFVPPTQPSFSDVPVTHWAYMEVEFAKAKGITSGIGNGKFGINQEITNNQAAAFISNSLGFGNFSGEMKYDTAYWYLKNNLGIATTRVMHSKDTITRGEVFEMIAKALDVENCQSKIRIRELGFTEKTITAYKEALKLAQPYTFFSLPEAEKLSGVQFLSHTVSTSKDRFSFSGKLYDRVADELEPLVDQYAFDYQTYCDVNNAYILNHSFSRLSRNEYSNIALKGVKFPIIYSSIIYSYDGDYWGVTGEAESYHAFVEDFPKIDFLIDASDGGGVNDRKISEIYVSIDDAVKTYLIVYLNAEKNQYGYVACVLDNNKNVVAYYSLDDYGLYILR